MNANLSEPVMKPTLPPGIPSRHGTKDYRYCWPYTDADGADLGFTVRYEDEGGKVVKPYFRRDGSRWVSGTIEPRPLFGLNHIGNVETVYVTEGEKCAAALHSLGLPAVTSQGGCNSALLADWSPLARAREIVILPDNDDAGERYARDVTKMLAGLPGQRIVKICRLPGLPPKGDVIDWLQADLWYWDGFQAVPEEDATEARKKLIEAIAQNAAAAPKEWTKPDLVIDEQGWEQPAPLVAASVPTWPSHVFPRPVQEYVDAVAIATETPRELAAMLVLATLATSCQGKYWVRVKEGYCEPLVLWVCVALKSGHRKTAVFTHVVDVLVEWEKAERERMKPLVRQNESERSTLIERVNALRKKAAKANSEEVADIMREIQIAELDTPEQLWLPTLWTQDVTPENVAVLLERNEERLAILSDEGGILDTMAGRYSGGIPNLDVFLQGHAGSAVRVDRMSRESISLRRPCLTIGLCPQPDVVAAMSNGPGFRGRGLLARFLYALPASNLGQRTGDVPPVPGSVLAAWEATVRGLLNAPWPLDSNGARSSHVLGVSRESFELWAAFQRSVEAELGPDGRYHHISDWAGKLPGAVARIAAVLHCARYAHEHPEKHEVGADDMVAAITLGEALATHALLSFDCMDVDPGLTGARVILEWVRRNNLKSFTKRDAQRGNRRYQESNDLLPGLEVLVDYGHIRRIPGMVRNKPDHRSENFEVHPMYFGHDEGDRH